ncbi:adenine nucleotide translocase lysine N-methyltransferase isoform X2 [Canis lupus baileyi]|uniref:adenine nucleotide translocase lysine N-methyltransferase isoform X2 n=2 Tax=Canis lupus baileyi TaxID=143281 RepID=UPI003B96BE65
MRDTERQKHRQREKQAPRKEPDAGLDPRSPGSGPEPKANAQPLSHPGVPPSRFSVGDIWRYYPALGSRPGQRKPGDEKMAQAMCVSLLDQALVPYVGASARQVEHVLTLLRGRPGKTVDLGSGDGRIVLAAHRCGLRPALGYELNPWLVGLARLHAWRAGCAGSVRFCCQDLWKVNLRDCHNVSVFLAPSVLPLLEDKLQAELPEGARVVSGRFPLPTWQPVAVLGEGLDRVWAYDVHSGSPAGQVPPGPSSASVPGAPTSLAG